LASCTATSSQPICFVCRLGSEYDFVKVVDFGVVSRHASERAQITTAGMILGTPAFLAPELVSNQPFDGRADIYALGCVAFWLLTGRSAVRGRRCACRS
jgi:serine/threonine-protein kinase